MALTDISCLLEKLLMAPSIIVYRGTWSFTEKVLQIMIMKIFPIQTIDGVIFEGPYSEQV